MLDASKPSYCVSALELNLRQLLSDETAGTSIKNAVNLWEGVVFLQFY